MFDRIEADYDQLEQVSGQFANQSQSVQQTLQKLQTSMGQLENEGWIGQGAEAFFQEMRSVVLPSALRLQEALEGAGQATKAIAQTFEQAEDEASQRFRAG